MGRRGLVALVVALVLAAPAPSAAAVEVRREVVYGTANGKHLLLDANVPRPPACGARRW
jgi:hypothetical protein